MEINTTTSSPNDLAANHIWQLPIVYIIGILGILGNGTVFIVFLTNSKSMTKLSTLYIFHQTIIDLLSSVVFLGFRTHVYYNNQHGRRYRDGGTSGENMACKIWYSGYVLWAMLLASNLNLMFLSLERYFAICHSVIHRNRYNARRVKMSMGVVWLVGITWKSYMIATNDINADGVCSISWKSKEAQATIGVLTFFVEFLIPLSVMTFTYGQIIAKLKNLSHSYTLRRQVASLSHELTASHSDTSSSNSSAANNVAAKPNPVTLTSPCNQAAASTSAPSRRPSTEQAMPRSFRSPTLAMFSKAKYNATKTLCFVFITFAICWTPAEVEYLIDNFRSENQNCYEACEGIVDIVVTNILLLNMVVNPLIYAISLREFQKNAKKTLMLLRCPVSLQVFPSRRRSYSIRQQQHHRQLNDTQGCGGGSGGIQTISNGRNVVLDHQQQTETLHL